jgi:hypothetical protein
MTIAGMPPRVTSTDAIVTGIKWVAADPNAFEVPAGYKPLDMTGLNVQPQSGGAIPPAR